MNKKIKYELIALSYFFLLFFLTFLLGGVFFEFIFWPFLAWVKYGSSYHLPTLDRLYKWTKLLALVVPVCTFAIWLYEKKKSGR